MFYEGRHAVARVVHSMSRRTKAIVAAFALLGSLGTLAVTAVASDASTGGCVNGVIAGSCGTQADKQVNRQFILVQGKVNTIHAGSAVKSGRPDNVRRQLDFYWHNQSGSGLQAKLAEYAPFGHASGLCMAGHGNGTVNLRPCNINYATQAWTFNGDNSEWVNGAGQVLTMHNSGQRLTVVAGPVVSPTLQQQFDFVVATSS